MKIYNTNMNIEEIILELQDTDLKILKILSEHHNLMKDLENKLETLLDAKSQVSNPY